MARSTNRKYRPRMLAAGCLVMLSAAYSTQPAAGAIDTTHPFEIKAQTLRTALDAFSEQSRLQLFYSTELVEGLRTSGVKGDLKPSDALKTLLKDSGLRFRVMDENTITLEQSNQGELTLAETSPEEKPDIGATESTKTTSLPKVTVSGEAEYDSTDPYNPDYNRPNAITATKTDTPIMETPVSVQVVPQQVLKDQQAFRLDKALRNVSGVIARPSTDGGFGIGDVFNLRGFDTFPPSIYRDGARQPGFFNGPEETALLERVEVLKGPAAILYGRIDPGGLINLVSKQPLPEPYYELSQQFGSFDLYRTTVDAGGPITEDKALKYRFNLAYEKANSFVDVIENDRLVLASVLRWDISPATQLTLELSYRNAFNPENPGIPFIGNRPAPVPRATFLGEPEEGIESDEVYGGFHWSHAFNDNWSLSHRFFAGHTDQPNQLNIGLGDVNGTSVLRRGTIDRGPRKFDYYYTTVNLTGHFETWAIGHTLLMGGDYNRRSLRRGPRDFVTFGAIDIFQPVRGLPRTVTRTDFADRTNQDYGFYVQDQAKLPFDLHLLAGFRYDQAKGSIVSNQRIDEDAVTPRAGLLWRPLPELSLYGSYTENFGTNNGETADGRALPPQTAQQFEVGVKTELYDGRLTGTLALFDLTKQNVPRADPNDPLFTVVSGEVRHRGVEVDLAGELAPGWQVIRELCLSRLRDHEGLAAGYQFGDRRQ